MAEVSYTYLPPGDSEPLLAWAAVKLFDTEIWHTPLTIMKDVLQDRADKHLFIAHTGQEIWSAGGLRFGTEGDAVLSNLATAPELRKHGLGRTILELIEAKAIECNAPTIRLYAMD